LLAARRGRLSGTLVIAGVACYAACVLTVFGHGAASVSAWPTSWATALVIGGAARVHAERVHSVIARLDRRYALMIASLLALGLLAVFSHYQDGWFYVMGIPLIAVATLVLIVGASTRSMPAWMSPFCALGRISYAVYLWNNLIVVWLSPGHAASWEEAVISFPLTILAAFLSWRLIESRVARYKLRLDHGREEREAVPSVAGTPAFGSSVVVSDA
jgi:peptidoglycan/LPS O-acetylase OafA/YrhL